MKNVTVKKLLTCMLAGTMVMGSLSGCTANVENKDGDINVQVDADTEEGSGEGSEEKSEEAPEKEAEKKNEIFTLTMPEETEGTYVMEESEEGCSVYDKEAREADCGGFAFSVRAFKDPGDYSGGMSKKVGEIKDGDKVLYDIVVDYPSDVQYDVTKYQDGMPKTYEALYNGAEDIVKTLEPKEGTFEFGSGCRGEGLYGEVFEKFKTAADEGWDANRLEEEDLSPEYNYIFTQNKKNPLEGVGYAYVDVNLDGIDELLVGDLLGDNKDVAVYDIFTMVDRKPQHVVSGSARDRYYPLENGMMVNEGSGGADLTEYLTFDIEPNTTNRMDQLCLKYDGYENEDKPWFVRFGAEEENEWENISEEDFDMYMERLTHLKPEFSSMAESASASPESEEGEAGEAPFESFKSKDGWSVTYDSTYIDCQDNTDSDGEVTFNYTGEAGGSNLMIISYNRDKAPKDVLKEIEDAQDKDTKVSVNEGNLNGDKSMPATWVDLKYAEKGSGLEENYILVEHEKGTLVLHFMGHKSGDEETDILVSDEFALIVDSLEFK